MENLGAYLQKLREDKGIDYKKVYEDLRIREDQVKNIEENKFFELGPFGLTKAMVHKYSRYLGGNLNEVMAELSIMMPENTNKQFNPKKLIKQKKIMLSPNFFWMLGIIAFVVVLAGILWYSYQQGWLKTPELFKAQPADSIAVQPKPEQQVKPDPQRERQRQLSETQAQHKKRVPSTPIADAISDSTDYIGDLMPGSQIDQATP